MKTPRRCFVFSVAGLFIVHAVRNSIGLNRRCRRHLNHVELTAATVLDAAVTKLKAAERRRPAQPSRAGLDVTERPKRRRHAHAKEIEYGPAHYYLSTNQSWVWMNPPGGTQTITSETDQLVVTAQTANLTVGHLLSNGLCRRFGPNNFTNMRWILVSLTVS